MLFDFTLLQLDKKIIIKTEAFLGTLIVKFIFNLQIKSFNIYNSIRDTKTETFYSKTNFCLFFFK